MSDWQSPADFDTGSDVLLAERITALLRHFDWTPVSREPGLYEVWRPDEDEDEGDAELLIPLDPSRNDYLSLVTKAQRRIYSQYGREARKLSQTLEMRASSSLEATRWKKSTPSEAAIIAWEDGERLYASARAQLGASAKATREARRYHGNASAYVAKRFLEKSFMGQTEVGSFVITALTPARQIFPASRYFEESLLSEDYGGESYSGRQILDTFERALSVTRECLDEFRRSSRMEVFLEAVPQGVSYEFTKALRDLAQGSEAAVEIARLSSEEGRITPREFAFTPADVPVLDRASHELARNPEPLRVSLIGEVTLLSRSTDSGDRVIRLNVEDGADIRKARIRLSAEQYEIAMDAHRQEASLKLDGTLEKEGRMFWVYNPSNLEIIEGVESDFIAEEVLNSRQDPLF
ncbi:hypothetical protein [Winogradskya humida]|uniref:Uncharacterized protein n=1 Tax=Winogradskya humida TaxID=113566 RepID=A0ABQ4A4W0_9ACTN|nr:hypothetical protein [Actinoplanes humidus]GIE25892.1 hypothetical protein Ahu01nite_089940 [Actinoplanes humidus]